jgi:predicted dehydrogenase
LSLINGYSSPLRAGLYGAGSFARFVLEALRESEIVRVAAVSSRTPAHAANLAAECHIPQTKARFADLLTDPSLDLIIISTPPGQHGAQILACLSAGKHVFAEKPLATTLAEAAHIIRTADEKKLSVAVDHPMLYTPLVEAATLFAKSRLAGPLLRVSVENIASCQGLDDDHWFWNRRMSGGIFVEHGVHFFDWCGRIAGDAGRVAALALRGVPNREDRVFAAVEYEQGAIGSYYHAFVTQPHLERTRTTLSFESVDLILDGWIPTTLHLRGHGAAVATTTIRRMMTRSVQSIADRSGFIFDAGDARRLYLQGVRAAADDLARSILEGGHRARNDARLSLPGLLVALAARESAERGGEISLRELQTAGQP